MNCNQCDYLRGGETRLCELDGVIITDPEEHTCYNFHFEARFVGPETDEERMARIAKENLFYE